jgi:hypothetical protein
MKKLEWVAIHGGSFFVGWSDPSLILFRSSGAGLTRRKIQSSRLCSVVQDANLFVGEIVFEDLAIVRSPVSIALKVSTS